MKRSAEAFALAAYFAGSLHDALILTVPLNRETAAALSHGMTPPQQKDYVVLRYC